MKKRIASIALAGSLLGGGIAVPLTLTAQSAYAAPQNSRSNADSFSRLQRFLQSLRREVAPVIQERIGDLPEDITAQICVWLPSGNIVCG